MVVIALAISIQNKVHSQDPQFSQYYAAPLFLNPALCGINQKGRAGLNYRNQWPSIDASFETYSFSMDYNWDDYYSSAGIMVNTDQEGVAGLRSTSVAIQYAYQLGLNYKWTFRPATEISYYWRNLNFSKLTFGDQFDDSGLVNPVSGEVFNTGLTARFFDLSFGGILFTNRLWLGSAIHHVLEPNQSITGDVTPLQRKFSIHGGYKILFSEVSRKAALSVKGRERSFSPGFNYRQQGQFKQLDLGVYFTLEPILLGAWYRGIPFKGLNGSPNRDAAIVMLGIKKNDLSIGYSFDYTISDLGIGSGGAHEISLVYVFSLADPRKPSREVRELKCPVPFIF